MGSEALLMEKVGESLGPLSWADAAEGDDRVEASNSMALTVRLQEFDDEKIMLVGALLGISFPHQTLQLKEILQVFWEAEKREKEEQLTKRNRKKGERIEKLGILGEL